MEFPTIPNSLELSRDGAILTVAHGKLTIKIFRHIIDAKVLNPLVTVTFKMTF